jgi:hypothetical protein
LSSSSSWSDLVWCNRMLRSASLVARFQNPIFAFWCCGMVLRSVWLLTWLQNPDTAECFDPPHFLPDSRIQSLHFDTAECFDPPRFLPDSRIQSLHFDTAECFDPPRFLPDSRIQSLHFDTAECFDPSRFLPDFRIQSLPRCSKQLEALACLFRFHPNLALDIATLNSSVSVPSSLARYNSALFIRLLSWRGLNRHAQRSWYEHVFCVWSDLIQEILSLLTYASIKYL